MKLQKPNTPPCELSTEALLAAIDGIRELASDVVDYLSEVLAELRRRGEKHPFFHDRILRFWREINDQRLSSEAAINLASRPMIMAVLPLSPKEQVEISKGKDIAVATVDGRYENMSIQRMDGPTLKRVFGPDGIRGVKAQAEMIKADGRVERHGLITVDKDHGRLRIGNQTFTPDQFEAAFLSLGFKIVLARDVGGDAGAAG